MAMSRRKNRPAEDGELESFDFAILRFYDFTTFSLGRIILLFRKKEHQSVTNGRVSTEKPSPAKFGN